MSRETSSAEDRRINRQGPPGRHGFMMQAQKPKNLKGTLRRLVGELKRFRIVLIVATLLSMASAVFGIVGPKLLGNATTEIFKGMMGQFTGMGDGIDFSVIGNILLLLMALYVSSSIFNMVQGILMTGVSQKISYSLRTRLAEKMNKMPLSYFDQTTQGETLSRMTNDIDTVSQTLNQSLSQIITSFTTVIGVLVMMISINVMMTGVALLMIPVSMGMVMGIVKASQKFFKAQQKILGQVNGHVEEMLGAHLVVKAFNGEKDSIEKFESLNQDLYNTSWRAQFLSGLMMPMTTVVSNFGYVGICILGGSLAVKGSISIGDIQAFLQYVRNFTQPLSQMATVSNVLQQTAAAAERVFEFLDRPEELETGLDVLNVETIKGRVTFENVVFGYKVEQPVIKHFSAQIEPGMKVAIVGPTGAGKTTLVKLLMRFYDLQEGHIRVDEKDITSVSRGDLRSLFGMVLQDTWLFNGTIRDNIRYGRLQATEEEVIEASKAAYVDSFVHMLPGGYEMVLNEESTNLSQGQKQLLTIARAILANPRILIFDEATSSVDTRTEILIQQAMDRLMAGRTSFIIAHRLSTIRNADLILVMNDGDIVEQGTHEALLAKNGFYANLHSSQ